MLTFDELTLLIGLASGNAFVRLGAGEDSLELLDTVLLLLSSVMGDELVSRDSRFCF
jgi:hypothetical protein